MRNKGPKRDKHEDRSVGGKRKVNWYDSWTTQELLCGLIVGEADGEKAAGKASVGIVVKTRVEHPRWWGRDWRSVIVSPKQFSCWDDSMPRIEDQRKLNTSDWQETMEFAAKIMSGDVKDWIGMPTHYHTVSSSPEWDNGMKFLGCIGKHMFYRDLAEIPEG